MIYLPVIFYLIYSFIFSVFFLFLKNHQVLIIFVFKIQKTEYSQHVTYNHQAFNDALLKCQRSLVKDTHLPKDIGLTCQQDMFSSKLHKFRSRSRRLKNKDYLEDDLAFIIICFHFLFGSP